MPVVYVDVLFIINMCMDFLALRFAGALLHLPIRWRPLLFSSALGGIYAVIAVLFQGNSLVSSFIGLAVAILLCFIAFGKECGRRSFYALCALFFISSLLLGGMITAFYNFLAQFFSNREELLHALLEGDGKLAFFFALMLFSGIIATLAYRRLGTKTLTREIILTLWESGRASELSAFVDSGNHLLDPLSGRPCIVLNAKALGDIIPHDIFAFSKGDALDPAKLSKKNLRRIRLVPSRSLGGERLLVGYIPDRVTIGRGGEARNVDALVVLDMEENDFSGCNALLPASLIT